MKLANPIFTKRLRQLRWFYQVPIIILMIPINLFMSYLYRICLPLVIMLPIVNWLFKGCTVFQRVFSCKNNMHINHIKDSINYHILPLYLLWIVEETFFWTFILIYDIILLSTWKNDLDVLYFHIEKNVMIIFFWFLLFHSITYVIHHIQHIRVNYKKFRSIFRKFNEVVPLFLSLLIFL